MSEEQAFLAAVRSEPGDPVPRLAFADWLEDRGDPRGEWVRLRVHLAQLRPGSPESAPLKARERELAFGALAGWMATDAPVWCLLGGGLATPPIPDWLVTRNLESWGWVSEYYLRFRGQWWRADLRPLHEFVVALAATETARLFRAGQSLVTFILSTAERHGLRIEDASLSLNARSGPPRFTARYLRPDQGAGEEAECEDEAAMRTHFGRLLTRLWCDTRGRISPPGV